MKHIIESIRFGIYCKHTSRAGAPVWTLLNGATYMTRKAARADLDWWKRFDAERRFTGVHYKILARKPGNMPSYVASDKI